MAVPRCARSLFGPVKRVQLTAPTPYARAISRANSSNSSDGSQGNDEDGQGLSQFDNMSLDERLKSLELDPEEFKTLWKTQQKLEEKFERTKPKTLEEAKAQWQAMQKTPDHDVLLKMYKHGGVEPIKLAEERGITLPNDKPDLDPKIAEALKEVRSPINVEAMNMRPLRRGAEHGIPVCDLQLRTYSIRNLMLFADFAMRVAYYMGLPARGPVPLPRITERWTVPRANFVFKKSQENFERITMRRLIQIQDGHPDVVKAWLAFLQKHQYYGVGMKANIWEYESLEDATNVGVEIKPGEFTGRREKPMLEKVNEILSQPGYKEAMEGYKPPKAVEHRA